MDTLLGWSTDELNRREKYILSLMADKEEIMHRETELKKEKASLVQRMKDSETEVKRF